MGPHEPILMDARGVRRVGDAVRRVEALPPRQPRDRQGPGQPGAPEAWVRTTSGASQPVTLASGGTVTAYPGTWLLFDGTTGLFTSQDAVWVMQPAGGSYDSGTGMRAALVGADAGGVAVYCGECPPLATAALDGLVGTAAQTWAGAKTVTTGVNRNLTVTGDVVLNQNNANPGMTADYGSGVTGTGGGFAIGIACDGSAGRVTIGWAAQIYPLSVPTPTLCILTSAGLAVGKTGTGGGGDTFTGGVCTALGSGGGVTSLNGLAGAMTIAAGAGITVSPSGSTITISATGGGVTSLNAQTGGVSIVGSGGITVSTAGGIITVSGGGSSLAHGESQLGADYALTSGYADSGLSVSLPTPGKTYLLTCKVVCKLNGTAGLSAFAELYDATAAAVIANTVSGFMTAQVGAQDCYGAVTITCQYTPSFATAIHLYGHYSGTATTAKFCANATDGFCVLDYVQLN